jgi:hypothetical protein
MMAAFTNGFNVDIVDIDKIVVRVGSVLGEQPVLLTTRAGQPRVGLTSRHAVHIAYDDRTRKRIREEAERLAWASRQQIPVPGVIELTDEWLITERATDDKISSGERYITAAIGAARAISGAAEDPPSLRGPVPAHGGGKRAAAERLLRIVRSPLSPREFRSARAAAAGLTRDTLAHGDYVLHNILFDSARDRVTIIDWEYLTRAPAHFDLLMLWVRLPEAADRDAVLDEVLRTTRDRAAAGVLHHWLAVRLLADLVTKFPPKEWPRDRIARTVERVAEARRNAAAWGA